MMFFNSRNELIMWVIDRFYYGYMFKMSELVNLNDKTLAKEIKKITKNEMKMGKQNNRYFLEYLY